VFLTTLFRFSRIWFPPPKLESRNVFDMSREFGSPLPGLEERRRRWWEAGRERKREGEGVMEGGREEGRERDRERAREREKDRETGRERNRE